MLHDIMMNDRSTPPKQVMNPDDQTQQSKTPFGGPILDTDTCTWNVAYEVERDGHVSNADKLYSERIVQAIPDCLISEDQVCLLSCVQIYPSDLLVGRPAL